MDFRKKYCEWRLRHAELRILELVSENANLRSQLAYVKHVKKEKDELIARLTNGR